MIRENSEVQQNNDPEEHYCTSNQDKRCEFEWKCWEQDSDCDVL